MTELELKIKNYADNYYKGNELISDAEYDKLIELLKLTIPDSELLTGVVGTDIIGVSKKCKLPINMNTLAKVHTIDEFKKWYSSHSNNDLMIQVKIDGNSQCLIYKNGELVQSISRGDGEYGEDTTTNIRLVQGVIDKIPNFSGVIRGEVVLKDSIFKTYFKGESNPRNSAAGRMKQKDGKDCEKLNFIAYDVFDDANIIDKKEDKKITFLKESGFEIPRWWMGAYLEDIIEFRNSISEFRKELDYGIDGIVIKQNNTDREDLSRHCPLNNVAFKPEADVKLTKVNKIIWQLKGSQFAPVAEVEPVELDGTIVERASLSNINIMNELGIYEGAIVTIKKSGMIIPNIIEVNEPKQNAFKIPIVCPVCGGDVEVNESGFPICVNTNCSRKLSHRFAKIFDILGVKGCGDAFLKNLESECKSVKEFFELVIAEDKIIDKWAGGINGRKIIKQTKKALDTPITLSQFLATFDSKPFDEKKIKLIDKTLEEMYNSSIEDFVKIKGFGEITAKLFVEFLTSYKDEINELIPFFKFKTAEKKEGKLNGLSFCFTGAACKPRAELQQLVEDNGGINKSGVAKGLSYLVTDDVDSGSSKNVKAKSLGIPVISSTEFLNLIS